MQIAEVTRSGAGACRKFWQALGQTEYKINRLLSPRNSLMNSQEQLVEEKVLKQLVHDIGLENTRKFMESLDGEFQKRIENIRQAIEDKAITALAAQAHALKSSSQVSGAYRLADVLIKLEVEANNQNEGAMALAHEAIVLADLTRFAFLDVKLGS